MSINLINNLGLTKDISATNSVTQIIINTHCILCGTVFSVGRIGKLYCSNKCKQFGYNHKEKINEILIARNKGINAKPMSFFIDDFTIYNKTQKNLKRYKDLERKKIQWETHEELFKLKQANGVMITDHMLESLLNRKFPEIEENEFYNIEQEFDENLLDLNLKDLSLEQWSFLKVMQPNLTEVGFFEFVSSLSRELIDQLTLEENKPSNLKEFLVVKNKFINHCNLIAEGLISFINKE